MYFNTKKLKNTTSPCFEKEIKFLYSNADTLSIKMSELRNKVSLLKAHIIGITEVKPKNYRYPVQLNELKISDNYDIYSKNVENSEGRGVILHISKSLKSREVKMDTNFNEAVWCEVCIKHGGKLLIGCLYRSDNGSSYNNDELNSLITEASQKHCANLLIMGDFKYKSISWSTFSTSLKEDSDESKFIENLKRQLFSTDGR